MKMLIKPASGNSDNSLQITDAQIANEIETAIAEPILQIDSAPDAPLHNEHMFTDDVEAVRQQYCANSGRPLAKVPAEVVANLITIHGTATTIKILKTQQIKYSYDWIWLNEEGLENLAEHRPAEYFIYATCKLLQDMTIEDELFRMQQAANAWKQLQSVDTEIIIPINELLRRLLGGYKRSKLNRYFESFVNKQIDHIAKSVDNLLMFQMELTDLIQTLIAKRKQEEAIEQGMMNFRMQRMIKALSALEVEVGAELNDFDIVDGKSSEVIHAITGTAYRHSAKTTRSNQYSQPVIRKKPAKVTLKFGGSK